MVMIVSVDHDTNGEILKILRESCDENSMILSIYDENVLRISLEPAFSKGWFGSVDEKEILKIVKERFLKKREDFIEVVRNLCDTKIVVENGNFGSIVKKYVTDFSINEIIFLRKKGFNPYWTVVKHITGNLCKKLKIKCQVKP